MIRVAISVEGQTEEEFVNQVLANHLRRSRVEPTPILLGRARGRFGGGNVSVERLVSEIVYLLGSFDAVTSFVDFYGFHRKEDKTVDELEKQVLREINTKIARKWDETRVYPYVQQYEFEGLLFSDVDAFAKLIDVSHKSIQALQNIRSQFQTPEDINDNRDTAPSKRIKKIVPRYKKKVDGPLLAMEMGLDKIRTECPRFNGWVTSLESLGS